MRYATLDDTWLYMNGFTTPLGTIYYPENGRHFEKYGVRYEDKNSSKMLSSPSIWASYKLKIFHLLRNSQVQLLFLWFAAFRILRIYRISPFTGTITTTIALTS